MKRKVSEGVRDGIQRKYGIVKGGQGGRAFVGLIREKKIQVTGH